MSSRRHIDLDGSALSSDGSGATDVASDDLGHYVAVATHSGRVTVTDANAGATVVTFQAHASPVTRVAWAASKFGAVLATSSLDGNVAVWVMGKAAAGSGHGSAAMNASLQRSVNGSGAPVYSIDWAPCEFGLMLAVAGSGDGRVHLFSAAEAAVGSAANWQTQHFDAHVTTAGGCCAVSWLPCLAPSSLSAMPFTVTAANQQQQQPPLVIPPPRLVTSGLERTVKVWRYAPQDKSWMQDTELTQLTTTSNAYIRDVAVAPHHGLPFVYLAAGTEDGLVAVWRQDGLDGKWLLSMLPQPFSAPVCRVTWSSVGTFLCVNCADGTSTLWKEDRMGEWRLAHNDMR